MTHPSAVSGVFRRPFPEQLAFFKAKMGNRVPTQRWDDLVGAAHDDAFMVAGAMEADLLADLAAAVDLASSEGQGIEAFRREFRDIVRRRGWTGWTGEGSTRGEAWRVRTILRTNAYTSWSAGRFAQLTEDGFKFWVYRHGGSLEPRLHHLSWDGLALPPDHEFWRTHYPPSDWGCSCYVVGTNSEAGVRRLGGDPDKQLPDGWRTRDPKTGELIGVGRGWGYAPGASVAARTSAIARKIEQMPAPLGAALGATFSDRQREDLAADFSRFVDEALSSHPRGRSMTIGALRPEWVHAATARGVAPATAELVVRDDDIWHALRPVGGRSPLPVDWYRDLPLHLAEPRAVLLDKGRTPPRLYLIFDGTGPASDSNPPRNRVVIIVDYVLKKKKGVVNIVRTGDEARADDVGSMLGQPGIELLAGAL